VAEAFSANVAGAKALNAFIVETPEHALAAAKAADADRAAGTIGSGRRACQRCLPRRRAGACGRRPKVGWASPGWWRCSLIARSIDRG